MGISRTRLEVLSIRIWIIFFCLVPQKLTALVYLIANQYLECIGVALSGSNHITKFFPRSQVVISLQADKNDLQRHETENMDAQLNPPSVVLLTT